MALCCFLASDEHEVCFHCDFYEMQTSLSFKQFSIGRKQYFYTKLQNREIFVQICLFSLSFLSNQLFWGPLFSGKLTLRACRENLESDCSNISIAFPFRILSNVWGLFKTCSHPLILLLCPTCFANAFFPGLFYCLLLRLVWSRNVWRSKLQGVKCYLSCYNLIIYSCLWWSSFISDLSSGQFEMFRRLWSSGVNAAH